MNGQLKNRNDRFIGEPTPMTDLPMDRFGLGCPAVSVRTVLFHHFVVDAHDEERRRPLSYEESPVIFSHDLQDSGTCHGGDRCSKISGRRDLRGLGFDAGSELVFSFAAAARSGAWKIHESVLTGRTSLTMGLSPKLVEVLPRRHLCRAPTPSR
jgi:hypothetical protein